MSRIATAALSCALLAGLSACGKSQPSGDGGARHAELLEAQAKLEKQIDDLATTNAMLMKKIDDMSIDVSAIRKLAEQFAEDDAEEEAARKAASRRR